MNIKMYLSKLPNVFVLISNSNVTACCIIRQLRPGATLGNISDRSLLSVITGEKSALQVQKADIQDLILDDNSILQKRPITYGNNMFIVQQGHMNSRKKVIFVFA